MRLMSILSGLLRPGAVRAAAPLLLVVAASCATAPAGKGTAPGQVAAPAAPAKPAEAAAAEPVEPAEPPRPKIALSEDLLYQILVAEFAGQRGQLDISVQN